MVIHLLFGTGDDKNVVNTGLILQPQKSFALCKRNPKRCLWKPPPFEKGGRKLLPAAEKIPRIESFSFSLAFLLGKEELRVVSIMTVKSLTIERWREANPFLLV